MVLRGSYFSSWITRPVTDLSRREVLDRYRVLCEKHGVGMANKSMRVLSGLLNYGKAIYPTLEDRGNPVRALLRPGRSVRYGLLGSIDPSTLVGLRDRALIALLVYTFARVGAATKMRVEDVYTQARRTWVRLHEKGGKRHEMPCHHNLEAWLVEYINRAGLDATPKAWLFPTTEGQSGVLTERPMQQTDVYRMIQRRGFSIGVRTKIGCHTFRATGITEYLRNGGKLEIAQQMANHESARTTGLYDRRDDQLTLDEVERILI